MTEQLEANILKKQNTELAVKIQSYRKQNRQLEGKNQELETWVTNFAAIVSSLEAAMRVFIQNEETLYALMKRSDLKEKSCLIKYTQHFKTFNDILTNLPERIRDGDRSNQLTAEIKTRIEAFVKSYEAFFKDFVDQYFKFTDDALRWVNDTLQNPKPDLQDIFRKISKKQIEYRNKMKQVQPLIEELRGKHSQLSAQNQSTLLGELLRKQQTEVKRLTQANYHLTRKFRLLMDYNSESIDRAEQPGFYECSCGGAQLSYFKREWEQKLVRESQPQQVPTTTAVVDSQQVLILQTQIEELSRNSTNYLERYEKAKIERNIEEAVLKSHAFKDLLAQCQELLRYSSQLHEKLRLAHERIQDIQRSRQKQLRDIKRKYDSQKLSVPPITTHNINIKIIGKQLAEFKTDIARAMAPIKELYEKSVKSEQQNMEVIKHALQNLDTLKRENEELRRKVGEWEHEGRGGGGGLGLGIEQQEFKHETHRKLMKDIQAVLQKQDPKIVEEFSKFVKSREKKASFFEGELKKRQKDLGFKTNLVQSLTKALSQTQALFLQSKNKVQKLNTALKSLQDDLVKLTEQNLQLKANFDNQKTLLNMRLKSQSEINSKLEDKVKTLANCCQELEASKGLLNQYFAQQGAYLQEMKGKYEGFELEHKNLLEECNLAKAKLLEYEKTQKRYLQDNESLRSRLNAIRKAQTKKQSMTVQQDPQMLLIQLQNLRNKLYCSCKNDREIEVSLKTCPHVFCKKCIDDITNNRYRFCPLCKTKFSRSDVNAIKWN